MWHTSAKVPVPMTAHRSLTTHATHRGVVQTRESVRREACGVAVERVRPSGYHGKLNSTLDDLMIAITRREVQ